MPVQTVIKVRRDTAANWLSTNPVLASGEQGYETDTGLIKIGNGTAAWDALSYAAVSRITEEVKNSTGATIPKGSVVYISGATGDNALISLSDADTEATSSKTLGLVAAAIADGATGMVVCEGLISGVNTGSATAGQSVWLSSTAGGFVFNAPPAKPAHSVYLGVVIRAHSVNGEILVKVQNGYELNELHDVNAGSPADNNVLAWDSASSMWTNQTAAEAGLATVAGPTFTGTVTLPSTTSIGTVSATEIGYLDGVTSAVQTQINTLTNNTINNSSGSFGYLLGDGIDADHIFILNGSGTGSTSKVPLAVQGIAGQTANLQQWLNSSGTVIASVSPLGVVDAPIRYKSSAVSSNITLSSGNRYLVNTSAATTLTLPASPILGDEIQIFDASGTAGTYNITVANNSVKINGVLDSALLDSNGVAATFVYTGSTYGWRMG